MPRRDSSPSSSSFLRGPANFTLKLVRPGFGPAAELPTPSPAWRRHGGFSSAAFACNFSPATAAPLRFGTGDRPHSLA
jgi:hypothetical protein